MSLTEYQPQPKGPPLISGQGNTLTSTTSTIFPEKFVRHHFFTKVATARILITRGLLDTWIRFPSVTASKPRRTRRLIGPLTGIANTYPGRFEPTLVTPLRRNCAQH